MQFSDQNALWLANGLWYISRTVAIGCLINNDLVKYGYYSLQLHTIQQVLFNRNGNKFLKEIVFTSIMCEIIWKKGYPHKKYLWKRWEDQIVRAMNECKMAILELFWIILISVMNKYDPD